MINRYTVIGQPIAHSLSPEIHALFGELTQRRIHYTRTEGTVETFADIVKGWQRNGGRGCNITMPFKTQAFEVCDRVSRSARLAGSVNTIHMHRDGSLVGHTTDGSGLLTDLKRNIGVDPRGKRLLLLGAGGAARAVLEPLLRAAPVHLQISNRTEHRALELAEAFSDLGPIAGGSHESLHDAAAFDIVINATGARLAGDSLPLPDDLLESDALAYDMAYASTDTVFMAWARERGGQVADGFGMLVEQAADAFEIWEGVRPKTRMAWPRLRALRPTE